MLEQTSENLWWNSRPRSSHCSWEQIFGSGFHMCQLAHPLLKASGAGEALCSPLQSPVLYRWRICLSMEHPKVILVCLKLCVKVYIVNSYYSVSRCNQSAYEKSGVWVGKGQYQSKCRCTMVHSDIHGGASRFCFSFVFMIIGKG